MCVYTILNDTYIAIHNDSYNKQSCGHNLLKRVSSKICLASLKLYKARCLQVKFLALYFTVTTENHNTDQPFRINYVYWSHNNNPNLGWMNSCLWSKNWYFRQVIIRALTVCVITNIILSVDCERVIHTVCVLSNYLSLSHIPSLSSVSETNSSSDWSYIHTYVDPQFMIKKLHQRLGYIAAI